MGLHVGCRGKPRQHRKDRSNRHVRFDVARAFERIDGDDKRSLGIKQKRVLQFLRHYDRHWRAFHRIDEALFSDHVEVRLDVTALVEATDCGVAFAGEPPERNEFGELDRGRCNAFDDQSCRRKPSILADDLCQNLLQCFLVRCVPHDLPRLSGGVASPP